MVKYSGVIGPFWRALGLVALWKIAWPDSPLWVLVIIFILAEFRIKLEKK